MKKTHTKIALAFGCSAAVLPFLLIEANAGPAEVIQLTGGLSLDRWVQGLGTTLPNTSVSDWWYGCSATSAGMMMGYYDRNGYAGNFYPNLVPGGVAEAQALNAWPNGQLLRRTIASEGHQRDFYNAATYGYNSGGGTGYGYLGSGDDRSSSLHSFDCLADFMGTSQDSAGNVNGSTTFYNFTDGSKTYAEDLWAYGYGNNDGMCGVEEYVNWAGYAVKDHGIYSQYTDNLGKTYGFTFADYKLEIDLGRPVLVHVQGHTMLGLGYENASQTVQLYNTWEDGIQTMTWGGSYEGMQMWGVTVVQLVPEPSSFVLIAMGGLILVLARRA